MTLAPTLIILSPNVTLKKLVRCLEFWGYISIYEAAYKNKNQFKKGHGPPNYNNPIKVFRFSY